MMKIPKIEMFDEPRIVNSNYKCVVCENQEIAKGFDLRKGEYIYSSKLHKVEISCHWIFFCDSCFNDLKREVKNS